jgi:hypothetical protein
MLNILKKGHLVTTRRIDVFLVQALDMAGQQRLCIFLFSMKQKSLFSFPALQSALLGTFLSQRGP